MTETDFDKVIRHLRNALKELKKGEHDQLSSFYERDCYSKEEILNKLIEDTKTLKERWESTEMFPE